MPRMAHHFGDEPVSLMFLLVCCLTLPIAYSFDLKLVTLLKFPDDAR